jgi:class 3 adenylate cyclase
MQSFYQALDKYNAANGDLAKIEENKLWETYGKDRAVLCLDMSGFTYLVQKHGLTHFLGMIRRMQLATAPIVKRFNGEIIKFEADNLYSCFNKVEDAIQAAISINIALQAMNTMTEDTKDLFVSIGIAYGKILLIEGKDMFGDAVNLASKLGEDIAERGEILVTKEAKAKLENKDEFEFKPQQYSVSGISLEVLKVLY